MLNSIKVFVKEYKIFYLVPLVLIFALIYKFFLSQGTWYFFENNQGQFYNWLAKGFLEGKLGIATEIVNNHRGGFGDGILLNGQIYLPWGPFPAVVHAIAIVLTGKGIMSTTMTYWMSLINLVVFWLLSVNLSNIFFKKISLWVLIPLFISYASGPIMFSLGRGYVYEEAIIFASTLFLTSIFFLTLTVGKNKLSNLYIVLSGVFFGLALISRFNYLIFGPLIFFYFLIFLETKLNFKKDILLDLARKSMLLLLPIFAFFILQLAYNYNRFGSVTDVGNSHQSVANVDVKPRMNELTSIQYIPYNLANYLFAPVYLTPNGFLYFADFPGSIGEFPKIAPTEYTSSIFLSFPLLFASLVAVWFLIKRQNLQLTKFLAATFVGLAIFLPLGLGIFLGNALRYVQDFLPLFYLLALLSLTYFATKLSKGVLIIFFLVLMLGASYSFTITAKKTCYAWVGKYTNTEECKKLYRPVSNFIPLS